MNGHLKQPRASLTVDYWLTVLWLINAHAQYQLHPNDSGQRLLNHHVNHQARSVIKILRCLHEYKAGGHGINSNYFVLPTDAHKHRVYVGGVIYVGWFWDEPVVYSHKHWVGKWSVLLRTNTLLHHRRILCVYELQSYYHSFFVFSFEDNQSTLIKTPSSYY